MADILPVPHRTQTGGMSALLSPLSELCTLHSSPSTIRVAADGRTISPIGKKKRGYICQWVKLSVR